MGVTLTFKSLVKTSKSGQDFKTFPKQGQTNILNKLILIEFHQITS